MHPLHCLQSRIANLVKLQRRDDTARRQAEAAPIVLRASLSQALDDGDTRHVTKTPGALFDYLRKDIHGREAHRHMSSDPIDIFFRFESG